MRRAAQAGWGVLFVLLLCLPFALARDHYDAVATGTITVAQLPPEARETLQLIKRGGPFPYARDGVVFGNRERLLPPGPHNYYREYTVRTPGMQHRGPRRIVCGAASECYYTTDHYRSFMRIRE